MKSEIKKRNIWLCFILLSSLIILYSLFHITIWLLDYYKITQETKQIEEEIVITEIANTEVTEDEKKVDEKEIVEMDPYWGFIKMNYLEVDFSSLIKINPEVVSWISVAGTNIHYPVVQHSDNEYYLNHTFDGSKNGAGWVFMDYRNSIDTQNRNTIIYAHNRKDGSMFGSLKNTLNNEWY